MVVLITEILGNEIIVSVFAATFICHIWKFIDGTTRNKRPDWGAWIAAGGMPSSHSSFVCSLALSIGFIEGFLSSVFFLAVGFATIVVRDSFGVRRAVDALAKTVNGIIKEKKLGIEQILKITGHTPVQTVVGVAIGIIVPAVLHLLIFY